MSIYRSRGHIEYLLLIHVDDEVLLGLELPGELLGMDVSRGAFLGLGDLLPFHWLVRLINCQTRRRQNRIFAKSPQLGEIVRNLVSLNWLFEQKSGAGLSCQHAVVVQVPELQIDARAHHP